MSGSPPVLPPKPSLSGRASLSKRGSGKKPAPRTSSSWVSSRDSSPSVVRKSTLKLSSRSSGTLVVEAANSKSAENLSVAEELEGLLRAEELEQKGQDFMALAAMVEDQDWESLASGLADVKVVANGLVTILRDVLGPLGDAQGFAKAIIGIAASIVETIILVKVNNYRSSLLARRLSDMKPAIEMLIKNLKSKADALMKMPMSEFNGGVGVRFRNDVEALCSPLRTMRATCESCASLVQEWTVKGTKLFGNLRKFVSAKSFAGRFNSCNDQLQASTQNLQLSLQAMTFLNVDAVLRDLPARRDEWQQQMKEAALRDDNEMPQRVKAVSEEDELFRKELIQHAEELRGLMDGRFDFMLDSLAETRAHVTVEHEKTRQVLTDSIKSASLSSSSLHALRFDFAQLRFNSDIDGPDCIGQGSFGSVYRCLWDGNVFAVKLLSVRVVGKKKLESLNREAQQMAAIQNSYCVRLRGVCFETPNYALVMDKCDPDLHVFLGSNELCVSQQWTVALEIARGMEEVHANGIVHGDLRTPNILMGSQRTGIRARVSDFGLSCARSESSTSTKSAILASSNVTRAPEVIQAIDPILTQESDCWSFGSILFEILTGKQIWAQKSLDEVMAFYSRGATYPIDPKSHENPAMASYIQDHCWHKDPRERPSFREIRRFIEASGFADAEMYQNGIYDTGNDAETSISISSTTPISNTSFRAPSAPVTKLEQPQPQQPKTMLGVQVPSFLSGGSSANNNNNIAAIPPKLPSADANVMDFGEFHGTIRAVRHKKLSYVSVMFSAELSFSETHVLWRFEPTGNDSYVISCPVVAASTFGKVPATVFIASISINRGQRDKQLLVKFDSKSPDSFSPRPYNDTNVYALSTNDLEKQKAAKKGAPIQRFWAASDRIHCKGEQLGEWEKMEIVPVSQRQVPIEVNPIVLYAWTFLATITSLHHKEMLVEKKSSLVWAGSGSAKALSTWRFVPSGEKTGYYIQNVDSGLYWSVKKNGNIDLKDISDLGLEQLWSIKLKEAKGALWACGINKFVSAGKYKAGGVTANRDTAGGWEEFDIAIQKFLVE